MHGEEYRSEIARMGPESVLAVEDRNTFVVGAPRDQEDMKIEVKFCGLWGRWLVGGSCDNWGIMGDDKAKYLVAYFAWKVKKWEDHGRLSWPI